MKCYSEYKSSGIEPIGEIPAEWKTTRLKGVLSEINDRYNTDADGFLPLLSVSEYYGVAERAERIEDDEILIRASTLDGYKKCKVNDLVSNIMLAWKCAMGVSPKDGIVSPAYCVYRFRKGFIPAYYHYLLRTPSYGEIFKKRSTGIIDSRLRLYTDEFFSIYVPVPTEHEQSAIAAYLDDKVAQIDTLIAEAKASIEEYKAWKASIIYEAVTKGVRGIRPMKDSGVEWIKSIPTDWRTVSLKRFATIHSGITLGKTYPKETKLYEYPYLRVANVQGGHVKLDDVATIMVTMEEAHKYRLQDGDLLMTEGGDRDKLGRGTVWHEEITPCLHQNHVFALRTVPDKLLAEYVEYLSTSIIGRDYFDVTANQCVHLASTNSTTIMDFVIPYPTLDEQAEIVEFLKSECTKIDEIIADKQSLISDLEAYKKSLIFEVVTGKRKVV